MGTQMKGMIMAKREEGDTNYKVGILGQEYSAKELKKIYKFWKRTIISAATGKNALEVELHNKFRKSMWQACQFARRVEKENVIVKELTKKGGGRFVRKKSAV